MDNVKTFLDGAITLAGDSWMVGGFCAVQVRAVKGEIEISIVDSAGAVVFQYGRHARDSTSFRMNHAAAQGRCHDLNQQLLRNGRIDGD